ncbi:malonyl-CoA decarboxylase, mitochondrial-like [Lycorma delicatula]|uniref:malonyl-CoA decarboxylase, mitochondrial-like n=1 Tax=Lycorma delicatula TaxID=130591 RepID=UPI003F511F1E
MFRFLLNSQRKTVSTTAAAVKYNNYNCENHVRILNSLSYNSCQFTVLAKFMSMGSRKSSADSLSSITDKRVTFMENFKDASRTDINEGSKLSVFDGEYFDDSVEFHSVTPSTTADEQKVIDLLKEILSYQDKNLSSWIVEKKIKILCASYKYLMQIHKINFLKILACNYAVNHELVTKATKQMEGLDIGSRHMLKAEERLKTLLTPQYSWLFKHVGRVEKGVKFLVDMRTDVLELLAEIDSQGNDYVMMQQLNNSLKELLSLWFSVGFLNIERITWKSSCLMLQKISEYEAVHPVRNWADLKRRVGPYRRCFVYTHNSMPDEPIVVLHTALSDEIASSTKGIVAARSRMSVDTKVTNILAECVEDPSCVKAAIFYSITSTQKGLQGIELGNYLIKQVVRELQAEFPYVFQFSSLSPIPSYRAWLIDKLKSAEKGEEDNIFNKRMWNDVKEHVKGDWSNLKMLLLSNTWHQDAALVSLLQNPLMVSCAHYLYLEKRRGYAFDSVANFHLRNGAMMWRLNWLADLSPRGLTNSCGIMVNYRYFLEQTEANSRNYIENKHVAASEQINNFIGQNVKAKI